MAELAGGSGSVPGGGRIESGLFGGRVPYLRGGTGPREALVFFGVNALLKRLDRSDPRRYLRQVSRLFPQHRITILGYAGSTFDEMVRDAADVVPAPPDVVAGISFGGFVATRLAAQHPELVKRLVLLVSAHRFSAAGERRMERQFEALERGDLLTLVRENALLFRRPWYNWLLRLKLWKEGERVVRSFREAESILRDYRQLFGAEFQRNAESCQAIRAPTLVIAGTADQLFDRAALEETARLIRGSCVRLFEGETHMLPVERSTACRAAIATFLNRAATVRKR